MKYGLTIGINNYPTSPLRGCVNDCKTAQLVMRRLGFKISQLLDSSANKKSVLSAILHFAKILKPGDWFWIHISGHGTQVPDRNGDEPDGLDEASVLYFTSNNDFLDNLLLDDELESILKCFDDRVKIIVSLDTCHSGTGSRVFGESSERYMAMPEGCDLQNNRHKIFKRSILSKIFSWFKSKPQEVKTNVFIVNGANHSLISACKPEQTSADAYICGKYQGAFSYAFFRSINELIDKNNSLSVANIRRFMDRYISGYKQDPEFYLPDTYIDPLLEVPANAKKKLFSTK